MSKQSQQTIALRPGKDVIEHRLTADDGACMSIHFVALNKAQRDAAIAELGKIYKLQKDKNVDEMELVGPVTDVYREILKMSVKKIEGVYFLDGTQLEAEFNQNGELTDDCIEQLLNLQHKSSLVTAAISWVNGFKEEIAEGIEVVVPSAKNPTKLAAAKK